MGDLDGWDAEKIGELLFRVHHGRLLMPYCFLSFCVPPLCDSKYKQPAQKPWPKKRVQTSNQRRSLLGRGIKLRSRRRPRVLLRQSSRAPCMLRRERTGKTRGTHASLSRMKAAAYTGSRDQGRDGNSCPGSMLFSGILVGLYKLTLFVKTGM